ncbi:MAG: hypothetical protein ABFD14_13950 [Anaerolineaceae bacterium]
MDRKTFDQVMVEAVVLPPDERYERFAAVHKQIWESYRDAMKTITAEKAAQISSDGRSVALVVGHIAEWDRFLIQMCAEFLTGVAYPRAWRLKGYIEPDGTSKDFESIEAFNQYQMKRQAVIPWEEIQKVALQMGEVLYILFQTPGLMDVAHLEMSKLEHWETPGFTGEVPVGWLVWAVIMEHEGVEHAFDLGIEIS